MTIDFLPVCIFAKKAIQIASIFHHFSFVLITKPRKADKNIHICLGGSDCKHEQSYGKGRRILARQYQEVPCQLLQVEVTIDTSTWGKA